MPDRSQGAREVLTELATDLHNDGDHQMGRYVERWRDKKAPAPAAPETVTVDGVMWVKEDGKMWLVDEVRVRPTAADAQEFLDRIAADAQRIAALEHQRDTLEAKVEDTEHWRDRYERERDEAHHACEIALLPFGVEFMDPPDGGDVSLGEQMHRMANALVDARRERDEARKDRERLDWLEARDGISIHPRVHESGIKYTHLTYFRDDRRGQQYVQGPASLRAAIDFARGV